MPIILFAIIMTIILNNIKDNNNYKGKDELDNIMKSHTVGVGF